MIGPRARAVATLAVLCMSALATRAAAQPATAAGWSVASSGRFEVSVGAIWIGHSNFGTSNATETAPSGPGYVLFSTTNQLDAAGGAEGRLGVRLSRMFEVDAVASYSAPALRTTVTGDVENAAAATAGVAIKQIIAGGSIVAYLVRWRVGTRGVPFVEAGGGYLRQLYGTNVIASTGQFYGAGGGVKFTLGSRPGRAISAWGLRADARALARTKGVAVDGRTHIVPAAGGALFVRF